MSTSGGDRSDGRCMRGSRRRGGRSGEGGRRGGGGGEGGGRESGDPIIAEVMDEKNIDPRDISRAKRCGHFEPDNLGSIRGSKRYFLVKGFAWYRQHKPPTGCSRTWASAHSWCVIDLRQQRIIHKYGQDCRTCGGKSTPSFNEEARRRMAEYVCQRYLYRTGWLHRKQYSQPDMTDLSGERDGPHDQSRCDMCKMLGHSCRSRAPETEVPSHPQSHYCSSSSASSQSPPPMVSYTPDTQTQPAIQCTTCGSSGHSHWACSHERYKQGTEYSSSTSDMTDQYTTSQPQQAPRSDQTPNHSPTPSPQQTPRSDQTPNPSPQQTPRSDQIPNPSPPPSPALQSHVFGTRKSATVFRAGQVQTDPILPHPMLHCTFCGGTDHPHWLCTSQTRGQERIFSTSRVQQATVGGRNSTRPRDDNHNERLGLWGLAAVGAIAVGLGALLLGRR